jgi:L-asparaginase
VASRTPVVVVTTGGTISMRPEAATGKLVPAASGEEVVAMLDLPDAPPLELDDFAHVPSFDVHGELALGLTRRVIAHAARGVGVVVTHGTDTMEETVYLIDRLLPLDGPPVVLTGAQRGASEADADGPRNFRAAIRAAASAAAWGRGALVCFDGELHAAREVRKVHTNAVRGFGSPGYGPVGVVDGERVAFHRRPDRNPPLPEPGGPLPRVDLIRLYAGADSVFLRGAGVHRSR